MRLIFCLGLLVGLPEGLFAQLASMDSGANAVDIAGWDNDLLDRWGQNTWLRVRGMPNPPSAKGTGVESHRNALTILQGHGFSSILHLRWSPQSWTSGLRVGARQRIPRDLREAYQRGYAYGQAYGAAVAGFEIENEPDIGFVPENAETYMAFQKAVYLGLKKGSEVRKEEGRGMRGEGSRTRLSIGQPLAAMHRPIRPADRGLYAGHRAALSKFPVSTRQVPLVVMAPLALPPGPYLEQLVANDLFSYTDAFNHHYYGYAEDFSGVYGQFETAVRKLAKAVTGNLKPDFSDQIDSAFRSQLSGPRSVRKDLPVLLTEYGYGSLGGADRNTVEGRVRQWAWFKSVGKQIRKLRIAGPMVFCLPPYFERDVMEFGLSVPARDAARSQEQGVDVGRGLRTPPSLREAGFGDPALQFTVGNLSYNPADFGLSKPEPWMRHIGRRFGDNEASPALAWLFEEGQKPYRPKDWTVRAAPPSPVVIDFVAGDGLVQVKRYGGYLAKQNLVASRSELVASDQQPETRYQPLAPSHSPPAPSPQQQRSDSAESLTDEQLQITNDQIPHKAGSGLLVLYNFSDAPITGRIEIATGRDLLAEPTELEGERILAPMCRIAVPLALQVPAGEFTKHALQLRFVPTAQRNKPVSPAVFVTALYPDATGMSETRLVDFNTVGRGFRTPPNDAKSSEVDATTSAGALDKAGSGIPALQLPTKRNLAFLETRALATEEPRLVPQAGSRWLVTPGVIVSESGDGTWRFRITAYPSEPNRPAMAELVLPDDFVFPDGGMMQFSYRLAELAGSIPEKGAYFEPYFRTANGNLYQVWPRQRAGLFWQRYTEVKENYTMAFYGRANLPWRFRDNRPVSLVFFFRPSALPATYEVKNARIVRLGAGS